MKTKQIMLGLTLVVLVGAGLPSLSGCFKQASIVTPGVNWDVTCEAGSNNDVVNNQARTITIFCDVNHSAHRMYIHGTLTDLNDSYFYFEAKPERAIGATVNISEGVVAECSVTNPSISVYSSAGNDISLVSKNNQGLYNFIWSTSGSNDNFEKIQFTSQSFFPTSIDLHIKWNPLGVSLISAGSIRTINLLCAGEPWVINLNVAAWV